MRRLLLASLLIFFCEAGSKQNDLIEVCVGESLLLDCPAGQVATGQLVGVQDSSCNCTCPGIRCNTDHDLKHIAKKHSSTSSPVSITIHSIITIKNQTCTRNQ
ncbi:hypothetical protein CAPTEDRAFT_203056 [Capitella teleta]|uniref:Uncharacterized protein n=1 Tax=Capitella teleta TaxID=283909 RepID=R7TS01_CAPTE|nr:hypothetical protein CAPTEDRAFT_203056 [Capitella teleta]|eukprot:ELT96419.1 hypothetical protein CAPTEDRAFT_203056 [Capitella teleta]